MYLPAIVKSVVKDFYEKFSSAIRQAREKDAYLKLKVEYMLLFAKIKIICYHK